MSKKELERMLKEYKPKYLYQRYNGEIAKLEVVKKNMLVNTKTGITADLNRVMMLGKISENIMDLIEEGDYVNGERVIYNGDTEIQLVTGVFDKDIIKIKSILTHEQFASMEYKI